MPLGSRSLYADDWPPPILEDVLLFEPKTQLDNPGQPLPSMTLPFVSPPTAPPDDVSPPDLNDPFAESAPWLLVEFSPATTYQGTHFDGPASQTDVVGGGFAARMTLFAANRNVKPFVAGHYDAFSGGSDWSASGGVVIRPILGPIDFVELGAAYDWVATHGRFSTTRTLDRHQITTAVGILLTDATRVRAIHSIPISGSQVVPANGVAAILRRRRKTELSLDQRLAENIQSSLKWIHLTEPDKSIAGAVVDMCVSESASVFSEVYVDFEGDAFAVVGFELFSSPRNACGFRPLLETGRTRFDAFTNISALVEVE